MSPTEYGRVPVGTAQYYGNLARAAIGFYIKTGNPAELDAVYWYTRYAVRAIL